MNELNAKVAEILGMASETDTTLLPEKLAKLAPIHMSDSLCQQATLCGVYFMSSVLRTPHRSAVTCKDCIGIYNSAIAAAERKEGT